MQIRIASLADQAALTAFGARTFDETFGPENRREDMDEYLAAAFNAERQHAELSDPASLTLMGEMDGMLAAYAHLRPGRGPDCVAGPSPVELVRFYVDRRWHGQGHADTLMHAAIHHAAALGAEPLWLGVWERNVRAIRFYTRHGFVDVGSHEFMLGRDRQIDRLMIRRPGPPSEVATHEPGARDRKES